MLSKHDRISVDRPFCHSEKCKRQKTENKTTQLIKNETKIFYLKYYKKRHSSFHHPLALLFTLTARFCDFEYDSDSKLILKTKSSRATG